MKIERNEKKRAGGIVKSYYCSYQTINKRLVHKIVREEECLAVKKVLDLLLTRARRERLVDGLPLSIGIYVSKPEIR